METENPFKKQARTFPTRERAVNFNDTLQEPEGSKMGSSSTRNSNSRTRDEPMQRRNTVHHDSRSVTLQEPECSNRGSSNTRNSNSRTRDEPMQRKNTVKELTAAFEGLREEVEPCTNPVVPAKAPPLRAMTINVAMQEQKMTKMNEELQRRVTGVNPREEERKRREDERQKAKEEKQQRINEIASEKLRIKREKEAAERAEAQRLKEAEELRMKLEQEARSKLLQEKKEQERIEEERLAKELQAKEDILRKKQEEDERAQAAKRAEVESKSTTPIAPVRKVGFAAPAAGEGRPVDPMMAALRTKVAFQRAKTMTTEVTYSNTQGPPKETPLSGVDPA